MNNKQLEDLKKEIGFKSAFKATLGFYAAQAVVTFVGLAIVGTILLVVAAVAKAEEYECCIAEEQEMCMNTDLSEDSTRYRNSVDEQESEGFVCMPL